MVPEHLGVLAECSKEASFQPGHVMLREGDPANRFYLIEHGRVALESRPPERGVVPIQTLTAGNVLG